jgi:hypothetical protein
MIPGQVSSSECTPNNHLTAFRDSIVAIRHPPSDRPFEAHVRRQVELLQQSIRDRDSMQERLLHETAVPLSTTVPRFEQYAGVVLLSVNGVTSGSATLQVAIEQFDSP